MSECKSCASGGRNRNDTFAGDGLGEHARYELRRAVNQKRFHADGELHLCFLYLVVVFSSVSVGAHQHQLYCLLCVVSQYQEMRAGRGRANDDRRNVQVGEEELCRMTSKEWNLRRLNWRRTHAN